MKIEHIAYMTRDPDAAAQWYVQHLGFTIKQKISSSPFTHFLADDSGQVMVEIYNNPVATVPDYRSMHPLVLHLAVTADDVPAHHARLLRAGATAEGDIATTPDGDQLAMLRDPWGFAIQLVKRARPMLP